MCFSETNFDKVALATLNIICLQIMSQFQFDLIVLQFKFSEISASWILFQIQIINKWLRVRLLTLTAAMEHF
jgi:hypothetical protein